MSLKIENLKCGYRNKIVIENVSIALQSGEALCVLGPNGVGKSTLFKTILGQVKILSGSITIDNMDIQKMSHNNGARLLAYVPQSKNCSYQFCVKDIVMMGRAAFIGKFSTPSVGDEKIVEDAIKKVGIQNLANKKYSQLSGGEQQMVLLARAVAQQSKYIILDEPASNLDFKNQKELLMTICDLTENGVGVLMASHSPEHAFMCCDKTLLLKRNGKYAYGKTNDIITSENLKASYGIDMAILSDTDSEGNTIKACSILGRE